MKLGLALPQYDYSVAGESPLEFTTIVAYARAAEVAGFDSVWLSDHLFLDLVKYGGPDTRFACYEPLGTLAALARAVGRVRLGTLVLCEALRPATVLATALATLDRICNGRLDVGLGAGWYEPDYTTIGMDMPGPRTRLDRLGEAIHVVQGLLGGGPLTYEGTYHAAKEALNLPPAVQQPRPRVFIGGKGDRLLRLVAERADGWNTCWVWTPDAYRERLRALEKACTAVGRDVTTVWRTLGLYALVGENDADLRRRFEHLVATSPPGVLKGVDLEEFRTGRLVGTEEQVREQIAVWEALGVETLVLGTGGMPFQSGDRDDLDLFATAVRR
jgi:alkanesulfonate monooxygenase SsuD/methylene tetrahydromethanopterin reductase-like flavin-dependent oxidoreductase (luciferase family)